MAPLKKWLSFAFSIALGTGLWLIPTPEGLSLQAWHLFAIFLSTIFAVMLKPFPMAVVSLMGLAVAVVSQTLTLDQALKHFGKDVVWLIIFAFFIARGFIKTGLGDRIGCFFMKILGKSTLGLGYGMVATDLILSPTIPSVTARSGGLVFPILKSLCNTFQKDAQHSKAKSTPAYLTVVAYQGSAVTSAMFLTSMAGNPLIAQFALEKGVAISWILWAKATILPGLLSLAIIPYMIYRFFPPSVKETPEAQELFRAKLKEKGPLSLQEWIMIFTIVLLIVLWTTGHLYGINPTTAALVGICILLLTGVLDWKTILEEHSAWDTLVWFTVLVTLASSLNLFGFSDWFSQFVTAPIQGWHWIYGFIFIAIIYFYSHYFFASTIAHLSAMYAPLLFVAISIGTPPMVAALALGFISNLFGGLTHYGSGPAPILYGGGYVTVGHWWKVGFWCSILNIFIWLGIGPLWWKLLGMW